MGTLFRIKLYARDQATAERAFRAAFDRVAALDDALSDYKPASELNRICKNAVGRPVKISDDLMRVLTASQQLAAGTGGAFDITLGPVIHLWRQARRDGRVPDTAELARASAYCGYRKLKINSAAHTVELDKPGMQLDVGGIAKGYAADEALAALTKLGEFEARWLLRAATWPSATRRPGAQAGALALTRLIVRMRRSRAFCS